MRGASVSYEGHAGGDSGTTRVGERERKREKWEAKSLLSYPPSLCFGGGRKEKGEDEIDIKVVRSLTFHVQS